MIKASDILKLCHTEHFHPNLLSYLTKRTFAMGCHSNILFFYLQFILAHSSETLAISACLNRLSEYILLQGFWGFFANKLSCKLSSYKSNRISSAFPVEQQLIFTELEKVAYDFHFTEEESQFYFVHSSDITLFMYEGYLYKE